MTKEVSANEHIAVFIRQEVGIRRLVNRPFDRLFWTIPFLWRNFSVNVMGNVYLVPAAIVVVSMDAASEVDTRIGDVTSAPNVFCVVRA